ncbi:MAG: hypothetical protein ACR2OY_10850 [Boseongicola sp.]
MTGGDQVFALVAEHGPWVVLVFFLLWRDVQKEQLTRAVLDKNAVVLTEIATVIRERMPRA